MTQTPPQISIKPGYRPQSEDKTPLTDAVDFYRLRQQTNSQRWQMGASLTRWAKTVSLRGMRKACPETYTEQFARAVLGSKWLPVLTPTSDPSIMKQWTDVLGILKVQGELLDFDYLWQWAEILSIANDLDQAFTEAGLYGF